MKRLTGLWRRLNESAGPPSAANAAAPATPAGEPRLEELLDQIVRRLGFDTEHPGWTDALRELHRHSRRRRLQVIPDFFYTPVWAPADLPASVWDGTYPHCGRWDLEAQRRFLGETPSFAAELSALTYERRENDDAAFHWGNDQFSHSDASLYYSMIRRFRPERIVEVGAGHSTRLAHKAVRDNGSGRILCIDPHAPRWLSALACTRRPSAVTTSAPMRLSEARPYLRNVHPMPPPRVNPPRPVLDTKPPVTPRPKACVSWSKSSQVAPPCATARR